MDNNYERVYYGLPTTAEARREIARMMHWSRDEITDCWEAEALRQAIVFLGKHLMWGHVHKDGLPVDLADGTPWMAGCRIRNGPDMVVPEIPGFHYKYDTEYETPFIPLGWGPEDSTFDDAKVRTLKEMLLRHALLDQDPMPDFNAEPNPNHQLIDPPLIGVVLARYNHFRGRLARAIGIVARHKAFIECILNRVGAVVPPGIHREWITYSTDRKTKDIDDYIAEGQRRYQKWMNKVATRHGRHVPRGAVVEIGKRRETLEGHVEVAPRTVLTYWR